MSTIKPIRTDEDLDAALARIEEIFGAEPGTPEDDELGVLLDLVELYENKHDPIGFLDPISAIKFRMDQANLTPATWRRSSGAGPRFRRCFPANGQSPCQWPGRFINTWGYPLTSSYRNRAPACQTHSQALTTLDFPSEQWLRRVGFPTCLTCRNRQKSLSQA